MDDIDRALKDLEVNADVEEEETGMASGTEGRGPVVDNLEGFVSEMDDLSEDEREDLVTQLRPVRLALAKVASSFLLCILHY